MGVGVNKILFDGIYLKFWKRWFALVSKTKKKKKEQNILAPPALSLFLSLLLIQNQVGCLLFALNKPLKEEKGNEKDVGVSFGSCSWSVSILEVRKAQRRQ